MDDMGRPYSQDYHRFDQDLFDATEIRMAESAQVKGVRGWASAEDAPAREFGETDEPRPESPKMVRRWVSKRDLHLISLIWTMMKKLGAWSMPKRRESLLLNIQPRPLRRSQRS